MAELIQALIFVGFAIFLAVIGAKKRKRKTPPTKLPTPPKMQSTFPDVTDYTEINHEDAKELNLPDVDDVNYFDEYERKVAGLEDD